MGQAALVLASRSPRRAEYLRLLGVDFRVFAVDLDESAQEDETPAAYVERVARAKAKAAAVALEQGTLVLAADTCVSVAGVIHGKPRDAADAHAMLSMLSARWHDVHTAVVFGTWATFEVEVVHTRVRFRALDAATIASYWATGEAVDKAGAYGIQGLAGSFVERIEGSYSAVVGLPLAETLALLERFGIAHALRGAQV
jgi:septum formation protein